MLKYSNGIATNPMNLPIMVNGTIIATILNNIDDAYTIFDALLCTNGVFAVLITCKPTKFDTTP